MEVNASYNKENKIKEGMAGSVFGWWAASSGLIHLPPLSLSPTLVSPAPQAVIHQCWPHLLPGLVLWKLLPGHWVNFSVVSPVVFLQPMWSGGEFGQLTKAYTMYLKLSAVILHLPFGRTFYKTFAFPQPCSSCKRPSPTNTLGWLGSWSFSFPNEGSGRRRDCPPESGGGCFSH